MCAWDVSEFKCCSLDSYLNTHTRFIIIIIILLAPSLRINQDYDWSVIVQTYQCHKAKLYTKIIRQLGPFLCHKQFVIDIMLTAIKCPISTICATFSKTFRNISKEKRVKTVPLKAQILKCAYSILIRTKKHGHG